MKASIYTLAEIANGSSIKLNFDNGQSINATLTYDNLSVGVTSSVRISTTEILPTLNNYAFDLEYNYVVVGKGILHID